MKAPKVDPEFHSSRTVLVVDDDPFILRYLEKALSMAKYNVRTANSEDQALAVLNQQQIDIVLTDIVMGDSDGFRLAARIKKRNSAPSRVHDGGCSRNRPLRPRTWPSWFALA